MLAILATGAYGFVGVFSDRSPGESAVFRMASLALVSVVGAGLVGMLLPRRWYLAVLTAWGPMLMGCLGLYVKVAHPGPFPRVRALAVMLLVWPCVAVAGGFLGMWIARHRR
jgi:hypothetical protein